MRLTMVAISFCTTPASRTSLTWLRLARQIWTSTWPVLYLGVVVQQALPREQLELDSLEGVEVVDGRQQHLVRGVAR